MLCRIFVSSLTLCNNSSFVSILSFLLHLPRKMEQMEGSETSAFKPQTPGKYPKENVLQFFVSHTIGPNDFHPFASAHFRYFQVFLIHFLECSIFSTTQSKAPKCSTLAAFLVSTAFFWLNAAFAMATLDLSVHYLDEFHPSNPELTHLP